MTRNMFLFLLLWLILSNVGFLVEQSVQAATTSASTRTTRTTRTTAVGVIGSTSSTTASAFVSRHASFRPQQGQIRHNPPSSGPRCTSSSSSSRGSITITTIPTAARIAIGRQIDTPSSSLLSTLTTRATRTRTMRRLDHTRLPASLSTLSLLSTTTESNVDVVELDYTLYGDDDDDDDNDPQPNCRRAVLFLHGLLGNKRNFATIATALAQSSSSSTPIKTLYYTLDLRNHGSTKQWKDDMSCTSMAADVWQFIQDQQLHHVTLVGHSMGGKVAQAVALLYQHESLSTTTTTTTPHHPVIQGLVVLDMAPVTYCRQRDGHWTAVCDVVDLLLDTTHMLQQSNTIVVDDAQKKKKMTKRALDQALRTGIPDPALRAFCLTNWDERAQQWKVNLSAIQCQLPVLAQFDVTLLSNTRIGGGSGGGESRNGSSSRRSNVLMNGDIHDDNDINNNNDNGAQQNDKYNISYPGDVLVVHGGQSRFVRTVHLPAIQAYFPNHLITTIRGAGHWLHAEKPEDIISLLQQYLNRKQTTITSQQ